MKFSSFALIQRGYAVFGIGQSEQEARTDASRWVDDLEDAKKAPMGNPTGEIGAFVVVRCTAALVQEVETYGGDIVWDDYPDGIALKSEAEE